MPRRNRTVIRNKGALIKYRLCGVFLILNARNITVFPSEQNRVKLEGDHKLFIMTVILKSRMVIMIIEMKVIVGNIMTNVTIMIID